MSTRWYKIMQFITTMTMKISQRSNITKMRQWKDTDIDEKMNMDEHEMVQDHAVHNNDDHENISTIQHHEDETVERY
jgi:hypothetical protein